VVADDDIARMIELGDRWHNTPLEDLPPPLTPFLVSATFHRRRFP